MIRVRWNKYKVKRVLVDTVGPVNLLTPKVHYKLGLDKNNLTKVSYLLVGLEDKIVAILSIINLPFVLEGWKAQVGSVYEIYYEIYYGRHSTDI